MIYAGADFHIDKSLRASIPALKQDGYAALLKTRDFILQDPTDEEKHVVLAGDIFDKNLVSGASLHAFSEFVDSLYEAGIYTYFIGGNHDSDNGPAILDTQGAISLENESFVLDNRIVRGIKYLPVDKLLIELAKLPESYADILVLHIPSFHLLSLECVVPYVLDFSKVNIKARSVLVGDIHTKDLREINGCWILSPGSLHPCAIDQSSECGIWRLSNKQKLNEWEFCEIPGRKIARFRITTDTEFEHFTAFCENPENKKEIPSVLEVKHTIAYTDKIYKYTTSNKDFIFICRPNMFGKIMDSSGAGNIKAEKTKITSLTEAIPFVVDVKQETEVAEFLNLLLTIGDYEKYLLDQVIEMKKATGRL